MKQIPVTRCGFALVDDDDFELVSGYKWYGFKSRDGKTWYAVSIEELGNGKQKATSLHRMVLGITDGSIQVDHKNHNGLDCQKDNLRIATNSQNRANTRPTNHSSIFKGVFLDKRRNKWKAQIGFNKKSIWIGSFDTEIDAAIAYDTKAAELFGEFAFTNFPQSGI